MLENLIVFVEEESMEAALTSILPSLYRKLHFQMIRFEGKPDMLRNLTARLRGFQTWLPENWLLLVLVDRDGDSCEDLKRCLETIAAQSGLISKSSGRRDSRFQVVNRIVIEELESWFFGDWEAVQRVYPKVPRTIPGIHDTPTRTLSLAGLGRHWRGYYNEQDISNLVCAKLSWLGLWLLTWSQREIPPAVSKCSARQLPLRWPSDR